MVGGKSGSKKLAERVALVLAREQVHMPKSLPPDSTADPIGKSDLLFM